MKSRLKRIWAAIKPEPKRTLPLIYVHTFKTGERLYTYRTEDWGKISARYNRNIQEAIKNLENFMLTGKEWKNAVADLKIKAREGLYAGGTADQRLQAAVDALMDVNSTMDWFLSRVNGLKSSNEIIYEFMFCMFYVLEEERETGYDEQYNDKKRALLNAEPEMRDFFLDSLKQNTKNLSPISKEDTLMLFLEMTKMKGVLTFLNMPEGTTV